MAGIIVEDPGKVTSIFEVDIKWKKHASATYQPSFPLPKKKKEILMPPVNGRSWIIGY